MSTILLVEARFYPLLNDMLLEGARKVMPVHAAVAAAREAGRKYISVASEILGEAAA